MNNADPIVTADLYLAAALMTCGHRPRQLIPDDRRTLFSFGPSASLHQLVSQYFSGTLQVDALTYAEALRSAKSAAMNVAGRGAR